VNGGKWRQEKHTDIFGLQSSVFSHSFQIVQALVITYVEIFQVLAVEGDILLPMPFLDPTTPTVQPQLGPHELSRVWKTEKTISKAGDFHLTTPLKPRSRSHFVGQGLGNLIVLT
jgi:hypothetical protein